MSTYQAKNATIHGMSRTRPYRIWQSMKNRCDDQGRKFAKCYEGISYDPKWIDFQEFWNDMKDGYSDNLTLDRIDNSKGYSKENCRWATWSEQHRNKTNNVLVPYKEQMLCVTDYAEKVGLPRALIYQRLKNGCPIEKLDKPSQKSK